MKDEKTSLIDLLKGAAFFFSRVSRNLEVRTATVNAGVEGTEFFIHAEEGKTELSTFEGKVLASNAAGSLAVATGQSAVAEAGKAPVYRVVVRPRDAVQWALYYPPVIDFRPAGLKEESNDPHFYTYRASQLLSVGRVDEANADIGRALGLDPKNSDALALRSIIAVTQNEKGKALDLAKKAVEADPKSATGRIALSYAQQAVFDLPGALGSVEEAVKTGPGNALAWARLAELRQSFGKLDGSLEAARKAVALNPDLSRTQTVLGFSYLTRIETKGAKSAFEKAITLDDADPLPRLGLGLAKIREGNLEEGRREIEIAVSLDPDNSLIRSYLGKAYYEEKRDKLATNQFGMAKRLDPMDPTPYFYDAIRKQTVNRPVEALRDMQKAIELNDNRAVYRSRLLLDGDLAARSASLGRIYNDLGFQQIALVEGWKSVNYDPSNYSAHRFLSDSYAALPRHEIARVSELLQSQLLQPINITPIQPRLAESNLLAVSAGGPSDLSFNEFNPLFERDRAALQASGVVGENGTRGEEIVVSGLYKKVSVSVGQSHNETDGFRVNDDVTNDIYNAFVQFRLSPKTSIQAEYRYRKFDIGDIELRFFDDFSTNLRQEDKTNFARLGFRHAFSPGSDLLASFMYQKQDANLNDQFPIGIPNFFDVKSDQKAGSGELQHLYRSIPINVVTGAGYFKVNGQDTSDFSIVDPDIGLIQFPTETADRDTDHLNLYVYTYLNYLKNVTFTVGASFDKVENEQVDIFDKDRFNPKLGVTWNPLANTTLRAAAFRTLKRTLITNQTLEPTQVAGFNQFYDDFNSTESWNYGVAVDQKLNVSLYGGLEYVQRDLKQPTPTTGVFPTDNFDVKEKLGRAYLYGTPHQWVALTAEYLYERFEREDAAVNSLNPKTLETHRFPLGINVSHPSGLSAMFKATYFDQKGSFLPQGADPLPENLVSGDDQFWLCDAAIGYRLPRRLGIISVGAKNLFDKSFHYFDTDRLNPAIQPARLFFARITLSI
jgi:tetratricopeptide (TPR) repeat protein